MERANGPQGGEPSPNADLVSLTRSPGFWIVMRYAVIFGVLLAFGSLAFLALLDGGTNLWFTLPKDAGWFDGSLWWVAVTAAAGLLVGVLRRVFRLPEDIPGTIEQIQQQRVDPAIVPGAVLVSLVSLAGGASLGPEDALGKMGGGLGTWFSRRGKVTTDVEQTNALTGMAAAYGGLLASPIIATILVLEVATLKARRFAETMVACLLSSSVSFAIYFLIAGTTFLGIFAVPAYRYEDWQLFAAVPLGLAAGALALVTVIAIGAMKRLTAPLAKWTIVRPLIGGIAFGLVGVALPLTLFTGDGALPTVINDGAKLGAWLLVAVVLAKMLVFALCEATGFIGGPFLVMLFIGGTAGTVAHLWIPGLPEGFAFAAMFAALPGSVVAAPLSLILLATLTTQIGTLQTAPVAIAVLTAYLAVSGTGTLRALANRGGKSTSAEPAHAG
jgi:H+/Cl- antiporter ClcA